MSLSGWIKSFSSSTGAETRRSSTQGAANSSGWFGGGGQADPWTGYSGGNWNVRQLLIGTLEATTEKDQSLALSELLPLFVDTFADASQKEIENSCGTSDNLHKFASLCGRKLTGALADVLDTPDRREASLSLLHRLRPSGPLYHLLRALEVLSKAYDITGSALAKSKALNALLHSYTLLATGLPPDLRSVPRKIPEQVPPHGIGHTAPHPRFQSVPPNISPSLMTSQLPARRPQSPVSPTQGPTALATANRFRTASDRLPHSGELKSSGPQIEFFESIDGGAKRDRTSEDKTRSGSPPTDQNIMTPSDVLSTQKTLASILKNITLSGEATKELLGFSHAAEVRPGHGSDVLVLFQLLERTTYLVEWSRAFKLGAVLILQGIIKAPMAEPRIALWTALHGWGTMRIIAQAIRNHALEFNRVNQNISTSSYNIIETQGDTTIGQPIPGNATMQDICAIVGLVVEVVRESTKSGSTALEDFREVKGYDELEELARSLPNDKEKVILLDSLHELLVVGSEEPVPTFSLSPYQHIDFRLPVGASSSASLRNPEMLALLTGILLDPYHQEVTATPTMGKDRHAGNGESESVRSYICNLLSGFVSSYPLNYFLAEKAGIWLILAEKIDVLDERSQRQILQIIVYAMKDLNYVPFRELACL
ncbi:hypothetical protein M427DRAFT_158338, partial [Gonapodya prolifera JEL478]